MARQTDELMNCETEMQFRSFQYRLSRRRNDSGYMMIVVIFLMTALAIGALAITASIKEQIKRDHEEEMIHRGVQYARAIKRYYKKFGRYPATIEALEDTNHMRFLRKRYKDPLTKDGKWLLVRYGQVQMGGLQAGGAFGAGGGPGLPNVPGVTNMLQGQNPGGNTFGGQSSFGQNSSFGQSSFGQNSPSGQSGFGQNTPTSTFGSTNTLPQQTGTTGDSGTVGGTTVTTGTNGTTGDSSTSSGSTFGASTTGGTGQNLGQSATGLIGTGAIGGGAIIGVASASKEESLRIVNEKNHYKDWVFVYDPMLDRGGLINGPYDPKKALGKFMGGSQPGQPIGTPAGQAGNGFGNNSFGNNNSSFGNNSFGNNSGFGQQPQQPPPAPPSSNPQ